MADYSTYNNSELLKVISKLEKELQTKKYGLTWDSEKEPEQVVLDCENNLPILKRIKSKEIKTNDDDDNILIEGDNYHALTVLNYTHKEKIDVIYIDPPYNTGQQDFIYNDRFVNTEDSYRHSKWLNFMEKRLNLAKNLLTKDGVVFISIDDNELFGLKLLCDKIFGSENFIANLPTIMNLKGNNDQFGFAGTHEYSIVYANSIKNAKINFFDVDEEEVLSKWQEDEYGYYKKGANLKATGVNAPRNKRPNLYFPLFINLNNELYVTEDDLSLNEKDIKILPITDNKEMSWRWGKKKFIEENYNLIISGTSICKKQRPELGDLPSKKAKTIFYKPEYSSGNGTSQLKNLFHDKIFNTPKPLELIKDIIFLSSKKDSIILDFFAGSGTTGHAVIELNKQDNGTRKFILCTNNENKICEEVTHPRIKKIIQGYKNIKKEDIDGLGGNLKYFKTGFVKKTNNRDQVKINLTKKCTEMLCVKENIFNLIQEEKDYKIFTSNNKDTFLCIYYNFIENSFNDFIKELKKLNGKKTVYMFSMEKKVDETLFSYIDNVVIEAIPQDILSIYQELVKMNIPLKANTIFTDYNKANTKIFIDEDKDDGARVLRIVLEKLIQIISQDNRINILNAKGKEEKTSTLNDKLHKQNIITQIEWEENKTFLTIGNNASHGDYDDYDLEQVEKFYKHIQKLMNKYNIIVGEK